MAIQRTTATDTDLNLVINNGDFQVLRETVTRLGFRNEESVLRYVLAVLSKSATRSVSITDTNGAKVSLNPSPDLLASDNGAAPLA